jgi:hypothetical protein
MIAIIPGTGKDFNMTKALTYEAIFQIKLTALVNLLGSSGYSTDF